jgi:hypothetical protein
VIAAALSGDLVVGFVLGLLLGLLVGPLLRSWLSWREWTDASREADLMADVLDRMDVGRWAEPDERDAADVSEAGRRRHAS